MLNEIQSKHKPNITKGSIDRSKNDVEMVKMDKMNVSISKLLDKDKEAIDMGFITYAVCRKAKKGYYNRFVKQCDTIESYKESLITYKAFLEKELIHVVKSVKNIESMSK